MDQIDFSFRRRATRVSEFEDPDACHLECPALSSEPLPLLDISECGAKIRVHGLPPPPSDSEYLIATLVLGEEFHCAVRLRVVHVSEDSAGVEFVHSPRQLSHLIRAYFRHEIIGATLRPLKSASQVNVLRFSDDGSNWLEITFKEGNRKIQLEKLSADLIGLGAHIRWSSEAPKLIIDCNGLTKVAPSAMDPKEFRKVIRNIHALEPGLKRQIEKAIAA